MVLGGENRKGSEFQNLAPSLIIFFLILCLLEGTACRPSTLKLIPPEDIFNLDGQASFYVRGPDREGRLRAGFYFNLPDRARLEFYNPLGGLESLLWLDGSRATLYLPREKVYWAGDSLVITSDFFGGELKTEELILIMSSRWSELENSKGWIITRDEKGEVSAGQKSGLKFEVKEFFPNTDRPRTLYFEAQGYKVRARVLKLRYNQAWKKDWFKISLPAGSKELSWEEMSTLWKR